MERPPLASLAAWPAYRWLVVGTVCVGAFLGQLSVSIASLVLPTLQQLFDESLANVEWVAIAYLLVLAALVVPIGRLADLLGRKMLYTWGFVVFIIGSALCGVSASLGWLIAFRVVQAVGAAMLQANSVAIITAAVPRRVLGRAIGVQGAAQAVGLSVGPSIGGLIIDALGWQWVFFIAVPFGLIGTVLAWLVLPTTTRAAVAEAAGEHERFDWLGAVLLGPSVALILAALTFGNTWGWTSPQLFSTAVLAVLSLVAFTRTEMRSASPLIDPILLRIRSFSLGMLTGLLSYAVLFGALFVMPFLLERILGQTAAATGVLLTPVPIAIGLLAPLAGTLTDRIGARPPTAAGMALATVALTALALLPTESQFSTLGPLVLLGVGLGLFTPANNAAIMGSVPANRLGVAGGLLNMTRSLGTTLGVAATGAVLSTRLAGMVGGRAAITLDAPPAVLLPAFQYTLLGLAGLAALAGVLSMLRERPE